MHLEYKYSSNKQLQNDKFFLDFVVIPLFVLIHCVRKKKVKCVISGYFAKRGCVSGNIHARSACQANIFSILIFPMVFSFFVFK